MGTGRPQGERMVSVGGTARSSLLRDSERAAAMTMLCFPIRQVGSESRIQNHSSHLKSSLYRSTKVCLEPKGTLSHGSAWCESIQAQARSLRPLLYPSTKSCLGEVAEPVRIGSQSAGNASQGTADSILGRELLSSGLWMWQLGWEWGTLAFELCPWSPEEEIRSTWSLA